MQFVRDEGLSTTCEPLQQCGAVLLGLVATRAAHVARHRLCARAQFLREQGLFETREELQQREDVLGRLAAVAVDWVRKVTRALALGDGLCGDVARDHPDVWVLPPRRARPRCGPAVGSSYQPKSQPVLAMKLVRVGILR